MMEEGLHHEDLLLRIRGFLNAEQVRLWEAPYYDPGADVTTQLQELAEKYASQLSTKADLVLAALRELQMHSLERSKANAEFKESGVATLRVRATIPGEKPKIVNVQMGLSSPGKEIISNIALEIGVSETRLKIIFNGKVLKPGPTLEEQGVKNGSQIMALLMTEKPEEVQQEDTVYREMKATRDDATLLSETVDADDYMQLEDQSGKAVDIPPTARRALLVGLALHERGRTALREQQYSLALVLLIEADEHLNECSWSLLQTVDNWAVLQLDIAWCYLCLQNLSCTLDAAVRLQRAEESFKRTYGDNMERLIALKGTAANERVLLMRLYLLQGIVAFHQNKRNEAKTLLEKAENELNALRVDENAVAALSELGWSRAEARAGLRATGEVTRAHHYLEEQRQLKEDARTKHREMKERRALGICMDGSAVDPMRVNGLVEMGFDRRVVLVALRNTNNNVAEAVRLIQEQPELLAQSDTDSSGSTGSSNESLVEPDVKLVAELQLMGYDPEQARQALRLSRNHISGALDVLTGEKKLSDQNDPSTSAATSSMQKRKMDKRRRHERKKALERLTNSIKNEENDHLDTTLDQEESYLAQYKSLL